MARIRSVLRGAPGQGGGTRGRGAKTAKDQLVRFGTKWPISSPGLRDDEGNEHPLTASEFGLLKVFAAIRSACVARAAAGARERRDAEAFDAR